MLVIILCGLLLVRIGLLVVMLGFVQVVHLFLFPPLLLVGLRSFSGWVGLSEPLFLLVKVVHLFVVYGYQGAEKDADRLQLTDKLHQAVLAEAQVVCIG